MTFGDKLKALRSKAGKSRYRLGQFSGIDQAYLLRLETGQMNRPSREVVTMIALALVEDSQSVHIEDIDELLLAAGYSPLRRTVVTRSN